MNVLTPYDLKLSLPQDQRDEIAKDIEAILESSISNIKEKFDKTLKEILDEAIVNPWYDWIKDRGADYGFFEACCDHVFSNLRTNSPTELWKYRKEELIQSWRKEFPEDFNQCCSDILAEENRRLSDALEFERGLNKNYA